MRLTLIAAIAQNYAIGLKGQLPWHLPSDLAHFKALTVGKPILGTPTASPVVGIAEA